MPAHSLVSSMDLIFTDRKQFNELLEEACAETNRLRQDIIQRVKLHNGSQDERLEGNLRSKFAQSQNNENVIRQMWRRTEDQRSVVDNGIDEYGLLTALKAFTRLEQVRLMPCHVDVDDWWSKSCSAFLTFGGYDHGRSCISPRRYYVHDC
jgi:hypothetical protein